MSSLGSISYKDILDEFDGFGKYKNRLTSINSNYIEIKIWNKLKSKNTLKAYNQYIKEYPNGLYKDEATKKINYFIKEEEAWKLVCKQDTIEDYKNYLKYYPNGLYKDEAERNLSILNNEITLESYPNNRLFIYNKNGKKGIINKERKIITNAIYTDIYILGGRLICVCNNNKQGLIDIYGNIILELGNYNLRIGEGKYAPKKVIRKEDYYLLNYIYSMFYETIEPGVEGKFLIEYAVSDKYINNSIIKILDIKNNKFGCLDKNNKLLLKPIYSYVKFYSNGIGLIFKNKNNCAGLIDLNYKLFFKCDCEDILWLDYNVNYGVIIANGKRNIIDKTGKMIGFQFYDHIQSLSNGFFIIKDKKMGLVNNKGKLILDVIYDDITYIEDRDIFILKKNKKYGFANNKGKIIIYPKIVRMYEGPKFEEIIDGYLFERRSYPTKIKVEDKDCYYVFGIINMTGEYILDLDYIEINYIGNESVWIDLPKRYNDYYIYQIKTKMFQYGILIYSENDDKFIKVLTDIEIKYIKILNKRIYRRTKLLIEYSNFSKDTFYIIDEEGNILLESKNKITYEIKKHFLLKKYVNLNNE